jgi:hypothetical protein
VQRGPPWTGADVVAFLELLLVEPKRFRNDAAFRDVVMRGLPEALDPTVPVELRDRLLRYLGPLLGVDFAVSETIETAWGAAPRASLERRAADGADLGRVIDDGSGRVEASIFSLSSALFDTPTALAFLEGVRAAAPDRAIVVLVDPVLEAELASSVGPLGIELIGIDGQSYSVWPRDPFSFLRRPDGGVALLLRPDRQPTRESDREMALELIQGLPESLDRKWKRPVWREAGVAFHNGQYLLTPDELWTTSHAVGPRIKELLDDPEVDLRTTDGWNRYVAAARRASDEIGALYGRRVHFVHPLEPREGEPPAPEFVRALGGGMGYDLDSVLTLLPDGDGVEFLLGDLSAGAALLGRVSREELDRFAAAYGLAARGDALRASLIGAQSAGAAAGLQRFLRQVDDHLRAGSQTVRRLPLILVPDDLIAGDGTVRRPFLVGWNNVVLDISDDERRAEGFSSGLPTGDALATDAFAKRGWVLLLLPPLIDSVTRGGGYRCVSQHLRR